MNADLNLAITQILEVLVATLLWILAVVLVVAGIAHCDPAGQLVLGIVLIIVGLCVGPGGVDVFT